MKIAILILIILPFYCFSQKQSQPGDSIRSAALSIVQNEANDSGKAAKIFHWIRRNIIYDKSKPVLRYLPDSEWETAMQVLRDRSGICYDYAVLTKALMNSVGVECEVVYGIVHLYQDESEQKVDTFAHAWNAAKINGNWKLMDCTWASNDYEAGVDNDFYLFSSPDAFVMAHYPYQSGWQLRRNAVTLKEFLDMPVIPEEAFEYITPEYPPSRNLHVKDGIVEIKNFAKQDVGLVFTLYQNGKKTSITPIVVKAPSLTTYRIPIKNPGKCVLGIGFKTTSGDFSAVTEDLIKYNILN